MRKWQGGRVGNPTQWRPRMRRTTSDVLALACCELTHWLANLIQPSKHQVAAPFLRRCDVVNLGWLRRCCSRQGTRVGNRTQWRPRMRRTTSDVLAFNSVLRVDSLIGKPYSTEEAPCRRSLHVPMWRSKFGSACANATADRCIVQQTLSADGILESAAQFNQGHACVGLRLTYCW